MDTEVADNNRSVSDSADLILNYTDNINERSFDLSLYGIKFSDFIEGFKQNCSIGNGKYDYMSFLQITDNASYFLLNKDYDNPNDILNSLITPLLNQITVRGGKKNMKGGAHQMYIIILLLYLLAINKVLADLRASEVIEDQLINTYGPKQNWPWNPPPQPTYWFYLSNAELNKYKIALKRHEDFLKLHDKFKEAVESEGKKQEQTVEAVLQLAESSNQQAKNTVTYMKNNEEQTKEIQKLRDSNEFFRSIVIMMFTGAFTYLVSIYVHKYYPSNTSNTSNTSTALTPSNFRDNRKATLMNMINPTAPNEVAVRSDLRNSSYPRITGGKTKVYRKKRTTKGRKTRRH